MERGRKNRRNIRKQAVRNAVMLVQTIRRRILFTGGSGVLSTTLLAGVVLATAGNGCFVGVDVAGGAPAARVSPGFGLAVVLADNSSLTVLSTNANLRWLDSSDTRQRCSRVKIVQLPALQGSTLCARTAIRLSMKSAVPIKIYKSGLGARIYTLFPNLLARGF